MSSKGNKGLKILIVDDTPGNIDVLQKTLEPACLAGKNIDIVTSPEQVPDSLFDPNRMGQVLDNLISNAIKFSHPGTFVEVGLGRVADRLEFYVRDEGPGTFEKDPPRLFTEFPQINVVPTGKEGVGTAFHVRLLEALT